VLQKWEEISGTAGGVNVSRWRKAPT